MSNFYYLTGRVKIHNTVLVCVWVQLISIISKIVLRGLESPPPQEENDKNYVVIQTYRDYPESNKINHGNILQQTKPVLGKSNM